MLLSVFFVTRLLLFWEIMPIFAPATYDKNGTTEETTEGERARIGPLQGPEEREQEHLPGYLPGRGALL